MRFSLFLKQNVIFKKEKNEKILEKNKLKKKKTFLSLVFMDFHRARNSNDQKIIT